MTEQEEQTIHDSLIFDRKKIAFLSTRPIGLAEKIAILIALGKKKGQINITPAEDTNN